MNDINLRTTFNEQAELYNEVRPRYPEDLFDTLVETAGLQEGARLLEIGPGTGQATRTFAERGYQIIAVELGEELAEVARRELAQYPNVEVLIGAFEETNFAPESFDLVYAATAFHWIQPEVKYRKPHQLLKSEGHLAIIQAHHVAGESDDAFFYASQPIYKKYQGDRPKSKSIKDPKELPRIEDVEPSILDEDLFDCVLFKVFPMEVQYSADEYIKLISTYSPTLAMEPERRESFLREMHNLINADFGGSMRKRYCMALTVGQKI